MLKKRSHTKYVVNLTSAVRVLLLLSCCNLDRVFAASVAPPERSESKEANQTISHPGISSSPGILDEVWDKHRRWSTLAEKKKKRMDRWRNSKIYLIITSVVLQALNPKLPSSSPQIITKICSYAKPGCIGAVQVINSFFLDKDEVSDQAKCKRIAESIKSEVYKFLALKGDEDDLSAKINAIEKNPEYGPLVTLKSECAKLDNIKESTIPTPPSSTDPKKLMEWYIEKRVDGQIGHKEEKIGKSQGNAKLLKKVGKFMSFSTAFVPFLGVTLSNGILHPEILQTVYTATTASFESKDRATRNEDIAMSYLSSKSDLERAKKRWKGGTHTIQNFESYVKEVEEILVNENKFWAKKEVEGLVGNEGIPNLFNEDYNNVNEKEGSGTDVKEVEEILVNEYEFWEKKVTEEVSVGNGGIPSLLHEDYNNANEGSSADAKEVEDVSVHEYEFWEKKVTEAVGDEEFPSLLHEDYNNANEGSGTEAQEVEDVSANKNELWVKVPGRSRWRRRVCKPMLQDGNNNVYEVPGTGLMIGMERSGPDLTLVFGLNR